MAHSTLMDLPPPPQIGSLPFRDPVVALGDVGPDTAARILWASGDVTIVLDRGGVIRDIAVGSADLGEDPFAGWIDRPFVDTVSLDSRPKIEEMLSDVASRNAPRWRQVNHPAPSGNVPVRYLTMEAGSDGRVIAIGRDMRPAAALQQRLIQAQQSIERDYVRLRQAEQRYRLLFDLSDEPVLIVDSVTRRITEANPAAHEIGNQRGGSLSGQAFLTLFHADSRDDALQMIGAITGGAALGPQAFRLADGRETTLTATLFRQDGSAHLLVRMPRSRPADAPSPLGDTLQEVLARIPDAFLLTNRSLDIVSANPAFLDLTQTPRLEQALGAPLARFMSRPEIDLDILTSQLRSTGQVRNFEASMRGRLGDRLDVTITAVAVEREAETHYGFAIRSAARRPDLAASEITGVPRSVEQLTELVGRVSLKDIVRESTDLIERLCIEAALRYTSNNRASAAEILGLSRQSLYSKLNRHGMGSANLDDEA